MFTGILLAWNNWTPNSWATAKDIGESTQFAYDLLGQYYDAPTVHLMVSFLSSTILIFLAWSSLSYGFQAIKLVVTIALTLMCCIVGGLLLTPFMGADMRTQFIEWAHTIHKGQLTG